MIYLKTPLTVDKIKKLHAGDEVMLSGVIYTGRDAAHKRLMTLIDVGPTPSKPGEVFGSGGPTTSGRMDAFAPTLIKMGLRSMIGKGYRQPSVKEAIIENNGVYFGAIGGAGAMMSNCIKKCEIIAFDDLGPEAIRRLEVENMPLVVIIDSDGNDQYILGREDYLSTCK